MFLDCLWIIYFYQYWLFSPLVIGGSFQSTFNILGDMTWQTKFTAAWIRVNVSSCDTRKHTVSVWQFPFVISRLHSHREPPRDPPSLSDPQFLGSISLLYFCSLSSFSLSCASRFPHQAGSSALGSQSFLLEPVSGGWSRLVPFSRVRTAADFRGSSSQLTSKCRSVCKDFKLHGDKPLLELLMF